jgi:hypothetical protein
MLATNLQDVERPDFVAFNKEGEVVLIAEVKGFPFDLNRSQTKENAILRLIDYLQEAKNLIPFAIFVDLENILIFRWNGNNLSESILCLNTVDVLSHYEPEFSKIQVFNLYLTTLTEAWLRDLAYHWQSEIPPASKQMAEIGLLDLLKDGTTQAYY